MPVGRRPIRSQAEERRVVVSEEDSGLCNLERYGSGKNTSYVVVGLSVTAMQLWF